MTGLQITGSIIMMILSVAIIALVLAQKDKQANLSGAISGGDSSSGFFDKTKGKHKEAVLEKGTRILAILFFIIAIATTAVILFF